MKWPLVEIIWLDTLGLGRWTDEEMLLRQYGDDGKALRHRAVGWLLRDDEHGAVIAATVAEAWGDSVADTSFIPKACIVGQTVLRKPEARP